MLGKWVTNMKQPQVRLYKLRLISALLCACTLALSFSPESQASESSAVTYDGLQQVKSKKLDLLYVQPGATLASYNKIWIDPVQVAFSKSWKPDRFKVDSQDRERIRSDLAAEFQRVFQQELQEKGGYEIVSAAGTDVLRVTAAIIDLYIAAPDTAEAGRTKVYSVSPGEMTLVAELRDTETGAILARVADHKGRSFGAMQWTTRATNVAEARRILRAWATTLREGLDAARGKER
jgi:hypothetical protein